MGVREGGVVPFVTLRVMPRALRQGGREEFACVSAHGRCGESNRLRKVRAGSF